MRKVTHDKDGIMAEPDLMDKEHPSTQMVPLDYTAARPD